MPLLVLKNVYKTYQIGDLAIPVLKGVSLEIERGGFCRPDGGIGFGEKHVDESPRLSRSAYVGGVLA